MIANPECPACGKPGLPAEDDAGQPACMHCGALRPEVREYQREYEREYYQRTKMKTRWLRRRERPASIRGLRSIVRRHEDGEWEPVTLLGEALLTPGEAVRTGKYCLKCESWRPVNDFYPDRAKTDGLGSYCGICMRAPR